MKLSFDYITSEDDRKLFKHLYQYLIQYDFIIHYYNARDKKYVNTESAKNLFIGEYHAESVLTLVYFIMQYCYGHGQGEFIRTLDHLLFRNNNMEKNMTYKEACAALEQTEVFLRGVGWLLYSGISITTDEGDIDCYTGKIQNGSSVEGIDSLSFKGLISGTIHGGKLLLPALEGGKKGVVNHAQPLFCDLAETIMRFRNRNTHQPVNNSLAPDDPTDFYSNVGGCKSFYIRLDIIIFIMLVVHYQYENLYKKVCETIQPLCNTGGTDSEEENNGLKLLNEYYIKELICKAERKTHEAYQFFWNNANDLSSTNYPDVVNVGLKPLHTESQEISNEQDNEAEEDLSIEPAYTLNSSEDRHFFLGGISGSGKSTLMAKLVGLACKAWVDDSDNQAPLPVVLDAKSYNFGNESMPTLIMKAVRNNMSTMLVERQFDSIIRYLDFLLGEGRIVLFVDGVNEAGNNIPATIQTIVKFCRNEKFCSCRCLVFSRILELGNHIHVFKKYFAAYELSALDTTLIKEQIQRSARFLPKQDIWERISQSRHLEQLAANPLQLKLLIGLLGQTDMLYGEINKTLLFDQVIMGMISWIHEQEDLRAPTEEYLNIVRKQFDSVLCALSGMHLEDSTAEINIDSLCTFFNRYPKLLNKRSVSMSDIYPQLESAKRLGILSSICPEISFSHDAWEEFYRSVFVLKQWLLSDDEQRHDIAMHYRRLIDGTKENLMIASDILCGLFELTDKYLRKDFSGEMPSIIKKTRAMTSELTELILMGIIEDRNDEDTASISETFSPNSIIYPTPDNALEVLARAISNMRSDIEISQWDQNGLRSFVDCRIIINGLIMNQLLLYRKTFPDFIIKSEILVPLFRMAAISGSSEVLDELFRPYWLRAWLLHPSDVSQMTGTPIADSESLSSNRLCNNMIFLIADKYGLCIRLLDLYVVMENCHFFASANRITHCIIKLLLQMNNYQLPQIIHHCDQYGSVLVSFRDNAILLMESGGKLHEGAKINNVHPYVVSYLLQQSNQESVRDYIWQKRSLFGIQAIRKLIMQEYSPALEEYARLDCPAKSIRKVLDILPLRAVSMNYIRLNFDMNVFLTDVDQDSSLQYRSDLLECIHFKGQERYHFSICQQVIKELREQPYKATEEVFRFFEWHSQVSCYVNMLLSIDPEKRHEAYEPIINTCQVIAVYSNGILLFIPNKAFATKETPLSDGFVTVENQGQDVKPGEICILEKNKMLSPLPYLQPLPLLGFQKGFVKTVSGRNVFIATPGIYQDFYYPDDARVFAEGKGEEVLFYPTVNSRYGENARPMAYMPVLISIQQRKGTILRSNLEMVGDRPAYVVVVSDMQTGDIFVSQQFQEYLTDKKKELMEKLEKGDIIMFKPLSLSSRNRCNLIFNKNKE